MRSCSARESPRPRSPTIVTGEVLPAIRRTGSHSPGRSRSDEDSPIMLPRSDMPVRYTAMAAPGHSPHIRQMRWETAMAEWTSLDCQGLCCALKAIEVWWQKVQESGGVNPVGGFALVRLERVISDGAWTADQYLRVNRDDVPALPVEGEVDDNCRRDRYGGGRSYHTLLVTPRWPPQPLSSWTTISKGASNSSLLRGAGPLTGSCARRSRSTSRARGEAGSIQAGRIARLE